MFNILHLICFVHFYFFLVYMYIYFKFPQIWQLSGEFSQHRRPKPYNFQYWSQNQRSANILSFYSVKQIWDYFITSSFLLFKISSSLPNTNIRNIYSNNVLHVWKTVQTTIKDGLSKQSDLLSSLQKSTVPAKHWCKYVHWQTGARWIWQPVKLRQKFIQQYLRIRFTYKE